jgi:predicted nucleotidyltransferase
MERKMKEEKEVSETVKNILNDMGIEYREVMLFGSRATDMSERESDWDFLVILKKPIRGEEKKRLWIEIHEKFHERFPFTSIDVILKDVDSFEKEKTIANTISNEVYLEGIRI